MSEHIDRKVLELADALEQNGAGCTCFAYSSSECSCDVVWGSDYTMEAATELRRLYAENQVLVKAMAALVDENQLLRAKLREKNT